MIKEMRLKDKFISANVKSKQSDSMDIARAITENFRSYLSEAICGHRQIDPAEIEAQSMSIIRETVDKWGRGVLSEDETRLMIRLLLEAYINARVSRIANEFVSCEDSEEKIGALRSILQIT